MAASEPSTAVGFFDLPPEIRNIIYHLALPDENLIKISRHVYSDEFDQVWTRCGAKTFRSIRRVNRQLRDEFTPILYNHVTFEFWRADEFKVWINNSHALKQHIRNIEFDIYALAQIRSALHELKTTATSLRTITFVMHTSDQINRPITVFAAAFMPFLRAVRKEDKTGASNQSLIDLITFRPPRHCWRYPRLPKFEGEVEKAFRKDEADVKAEMMRLLG